MAADSGAEGDQKLGEDRDRVGFCFGSQPPDDLARQPATGGGAGRRRPARRRLERRAAVRSLVFRRGIVERRESRLSHSAWTSATAARAEDSSTIAFFCANAAISDCTARLLTSRGRPREAWWISATASSVNSLSERPASLR